MLSKINQTLLSVAVTVGVVGVTAYVVRQSAIAAMGKATQVDMSRVDPLNENNFINEYFTKGYQLITGSQQSLGADVYDWLHPNNTSKTETSVKSQKDDWMRLQSSH